MKLFNMYIFKNMSCWRPAQWMDWGEAPKHFPKPPLQEKTVMVNVWWSAARTDPLQLSELVCLRSMLSKSMRCNENSKACSQPWSTERVQSSPWLHITQLTLQKFNKLGYYVLSHLPYSPGFLPTNYHLFKHLDEFLQGKRFHNQQDARRAAQEFIISQSMDFSLLQE